MREKSRWSARALWELIFPVFLYFILSMSLTGILEMMIPALTEEQNSMWLLTLVNTIQIPVFFLIYGSGQDKEEDTEAWKKRFGFSDLILAVLGGIFLSRGLNGLIGLTPLPRLFPAYEAVSETFYSGSLISRVFASAVTAPVLEEVLMRGLIYGRLRCWFSDLRPAILVGALVFAVFHGNMVQGVYAFFLGLYFVWLYEVYHTLLLPVAAHAAANISSILLEQTGWLDRFYEELPVYFLTVAICLTAGGFCWSRAKKKKSGF